MSFKTIRIRATSHRKLKELAESAGHSLQDALDQALEERIRTLYLEGVNADYAALSAEARNELMNEMEAWM